MTSTIPAPHSPHHPQIFSSNRNVIAIEPISDEPVRLSEIALRTADASVKLGLVYLATNTRLLLGTNEIDRSIAALIET
jgi:hypothetical protein